MCGRGRRAHVARRVVAGVPACDRCGADAVCHIRYSGQHLCGDHFLHFFRRRAKMEVARQGRLPEGTIAVALSGGKDSVAALWFMHELTRDHPRVDLLAVTVDEGIAGYRDTSLGICRELTDRLGVPWRVARTEDMAGYTIDAYAAGEAGPEAAGATRPACGACGVFRRHGINQLAMAAGAVAVVTGHNLDDMAQTVLMNHLKGDVDRLGRMAPHADAQEGMVPRLLPFRSIPEKEVLLYGFLEGLPLHDEAECPYAARAHRFEMRDVLTGLEARHPGTRHALLRGAERIRELLPEGNGTGACPSCGGPSSRGMCKVCQYRSTA